MKDGEIRRNLSRIFKIKTIYGQDDVACMKEVVSRRLRRSIKEKNEAFGSLPDVIFADGGITQIRAIKEAIEAVSTEYENKVENLKEIKVFGMVKNDKHQTRALIDENRKEIKLSENLMRLITLFQDTVHETAIGYHKKLRNKEVTKSALDEIEGIGPAKKKALLVKFGSVEEMSKASIEELMEVKGISKGIAEKIKKL